MKIIALFVLAAVGLSTCAGQNPGEITQASQQHWVGGLPGSGTGYNYRFSINFKDKEIDLKTVVPDSLWVNGYRLKLMPVDFGYYAGDSAKAKSSNPTYIRCSAKETHRPKYGDREVYEPETGKLPAGYEGKAVLSYYVGNKRYFLVINSFDKEPDLDYK